MAKQAETNEIVIYLLSHDTCKLTEMQLRQMTEEQLSAYAAEVRRYDEQVEQYKKDLADYNAHKERKVQSRGQRFTSKYKGVSWHRAGQKWRSQMYAGGTYTHLGLYDSEVEAAKKFDERARLMGRPVNFPDPSADPPEKQATKKSNLASQKTEREEKAHAYGGGTSTNMNKKRQRPKSSSPDVASSSSSLPPFSSAAAATVEGESTGNAASTAATSVATSMVSPFRSVPSVATTQVVPSASASLKTNDRSSVEGDVSPENAPLSPNGTLPHPHDTYLQQCSGAAGATSMTMNGDNSQKIPANSTSAAYTSGSASAGGPFAPDGVAAAAE